MYKMEDKKRSVAKAISFRALATLTTMTFIYAITGSFSFAGIVGTFDIFAKLLLYYYHERMWEKIKWGKPNTENYNENYFSEEL